MPYAVGSIYTILIHKNVVSGFVAFQMWFNFSRNVLMCLKMFLCRYATVGTVLEMDVGRDAEW